MRRRLLAAAMEIREWIKPGHWHRLRPLADALYDWHFDDCRGDIPHSQKVAEIAESLAYDGMRVRR